MKLNVTKLFIINLLMNIKHFSLIMQRFSEDEWNYYLLIFIAIDFIRSCIYLFIDTNLLSKFQGRQNVCN